MEHEDKDGQRIKEWAWEHCSAKSSNCVDGTHGYGSTKIVRKKKKNMALDLAQCFWETWGKSYDIREMFTWHISGRVTHPIPRRPVRLHQSIWHCCHILMSVTPTETYEEGCWTVHAQWQQEFRFQQLSTASLYFSYFFGEICIFTNNVKKMYSYYFSISQLNFIEIDSQPLQDIFCCSQFWGHQI